MKNIFSIIIISFILFGCKKLELEAPSESKPVWIATHNYQNGDSSLSDNLPRQIYFFEKDSLIHKKFYFQFIGEDNEEKQYAYEMNGDELIIFREDGNDTLQYSIQENTMKMNDKDSKVINQRLPKYNQAAKAAQLSKFLLTTSFEIIEKKINIEFREDIRFVKNPLEPTFSDLQLWMLDSFQNELFLVIDENGFLLHITAINDNGFEGIQYGKENKVFHFQARSNNTVFEKEKLIGKWERYYDSEHKFNIPPTLPKSHPEYLKYYEKEQLIINDSTLLWYNGFRRDTVDWSMNRQQETIFFSGWKYSWSVNTRQWDVQVLNENELVVKRINRYGLENRGELEEVRFVRKE